MLLIYGPAFFRVTEDVSGIEMVSRRRTFRIF